MESIKDQKQRPRIGGNKAMESSASVSSSSPLHRRSLTREKFLSRVILPAIEKRSCPICLNNLHDHRSTAVIAVCLHAYCLECIRKWSYLKRKCPLCNADFDSWFYKINLFSRRFLTQKLPALNEDKIVTAVDEFRSSHWQRRMIQRSRTELNINSRRSRPLPWRRRFGRPGSVPAHVIDERKLEWRASVYHGRLQAVPSSPRNCLQQNMKESIVRRIEPWICRELQAILKDPDPSVIVHVASSLFLASLEGNVDVHSKQLGVEDNFLAPLHCFLHDWTYAFWHELRCFAESSLTMETYDAVAEYVQSG